MTGENAAVEIVNAAGRGPVVVLCEHASSHIPDRFDGLGLAPGDLASHAAWDPGARDVALALSRALDAPMVAGRISRLVFDCNRPPDADSAMPARSERIEIPGNRDLDAAARQDRIVSVYRPFVAAVDRVLDRRGDLPTALVTVHSFTPVFHDRARRVEIGILHDADSRLADLMLARAPELPHRVIARNDPYGPQDGVTHSLKLHGIRRGLPNVMIEIRNDLLGSAAARAAMTRELLDMLVPALGDIAHTERGKAGA